MVVIKKLVTKKIEIENWGHPSVRLLADRKIFGFAEELLFEDSI